jgi:LPXTG-site transpeptidase (sortase) family protein
MYQRRKKRILPLLGTILMLSGAALLVAVVVLFVLPQINGPDQVQRSSLAVPLQPGSPDNPAPAPRSKPLQLPTPLATAGNPDTLLPDTVIAGQAPWSDDGAADNPVLSGPTRLVIPALRIDAEIQPVSLVTKDDGTKQYREWSVPKEYAAGWHDESALLGRPGNTVLNGHNNVHGALFRDLAYLEPGLEIILYDNDRSYTYEVVQQEFLEETGQSLQTRVMNARWILPTSDERITIVTCWPNTSNTHRIVVIAMPVPDSS